MITLQDDRPRDKPLSVSWKSCRHDWAQGLWLPPSVSARDRRVRNAILLDAILEAHCAGRWISYSRNRNFYSGQRRYVGSDFVYSTIIRAVDDLATVGLLEHQKSPAGEPTGWQSRFRAAPVLLNAIESQPQVRHVAGEIIRLKIGGRLADYQDTAVTNAQRRHLSAINEAIGAATVDIDVPSMLRDGNVIRFGDHAVYPVKKALHRVFNEDFTQGGRAYGGWWQNAKKKDRSGITIDGEATVEEDYRQLHPRLLYRQAGEHLTGDAYTLSSWDRSDCKIAFNTLLNASSYKSALGAVVNNLDYGHNKARQLIKDLTKRHQAVSNYFYTGVGLKLQNIDANMAEKVLLDLLGQGIVALPIHDSFIVQERHQGRLIEAMNTTLALAA